MDAIKYIRNKKRLLDIVGGLIDRYEDTNRYPTSCRIDLLHAIEVTLKRSMQELSEWEDWDTDYITIAHNQMHMHAADLLSSGRYHIWAGRLDPMSCASNLRLVFDRCLDYFEKRGDLSPEDRAEYESELRENIRTIG